MLLQIRTFLEQNKNRTRTDFFKKYFIVKEKVIFYDIQNANYTKHIVRLPTRLAS